MMSINLSDRDIAYCMEWVWSGDVVKAVLAGGMMEIGKSPEGIHEMQQERGEVVWMCGVLARAKLEWFGGDIEADGLSGNAVGSVRRLRGISNAAVGKGRFDAAVNAEVAAAKVMGVMVEKSDVRVDARVVDVKRMGMREIAAMLEGEGTKVLEGVVIENGEGRE